MTNQTRREVLLDLSEDLKDWMEDPSLGFTALQYGRILRRIQWHADQAPADKVAREAALAEYGAMKKPGPLIPRSADDCAAQYQRANPPVRAAKISEHVHTSDCDNPLLCPTQDAYAKSKQPVLSPRQALGEALACVERAKHLLESVCTAPSGVHVDVRLAAFRAFAGTETAWANATTARALLEQQK